MSGDQVFSALLSSYNEQARRLDQSARGVAAYLEAATQSLKRIAITNDDADYVAKLDGVSKNLAAPNLPASELSFAAYTLFSVAANLEKDPAASNLFFAAMQDLGMFGRASLPTEAPEWKGEHLANGKGALVITCADGQGFGDTFQLSALIREIKARELFKTVHLEVQPAVAHVMQGVLFADSVFAKGTDFPAHDAHSSLMRLPVALGLKLQDYRAPRQYLAVPKIPEENAAWIRENISTYPGPTVALAWKGDPNNRLEKEGRGTSLDQLTPLLEVPDVRFVSLQFGPGSEQIEQLPPTLKAKFMFMPKSFDPKGFGFRDTLATMAACDAVVSTDTGIIHAAGAIGAHGYAMLQRIPEGRWVSPVRSDVYAQELATATASPWYPSVTQLTQVREGDWLGVAKQLGHAVSDIRTNKASAFRV